MRKTFPEIFTEVNQAPDHESKVALLRKYDNPALKTVLVAALDRHQYWWDLPSGTPPYKTDPNMPIEFGGSNLYGEARRLYIFNKNYTLPAQRKEFLFIGMLEGLHHLEAELLCQIKDDQFKKVYPGVTEEAVRDAYPGLLSESKSPEGDPAPVAKTRKKRQPKTTTETP